MPMHMHPFTAEGQVHRKKVGRVREINGAPGLQMHVRVPFANDHDFGLAKELFERQKNGEPERVIRVLRSAYAQVGLTIEQRPDERIEFRSTSATVPMTVTSHRNGPHDKLLSLFRTILQQEKQSLQPGGLLVVPPDTALTAEEVREEIDRNRLLLPDGSAVREDGAVEFPLNEAYAFAEENFKDDAMRRVLRDGRHGLRRLRLPIPLPRHIGAGRYLLANFRGLSLGAVQGIIERETSVPGVEHLPAFMLDPLRTTGIGDPRQAELLNRNAHAVETADVRVRMRLYPIALEVRATAARVINPRTLQDGVDINDLVPLEQLIRLADSVSAYKPSDPLDPDRRPYGLLIGRKRAAEVNWASYQKFQDDHTLDRAKMFTMALPADRGGAGWLDGDGIPEPARIFADQLGYVGQDQHGKMLVTDGFPDPGEVVPKLLDEGIGVFLARALHLEPGAFPEPTALRPRPETHPPESELTTTDARSMKQHALFFDSGRYEAFCKLAKRGAKFLMVLRDMADEMARGEIIPAHVREFDRGFWVRPDARERIRKVNTVIAMYGSHVKGMEPILKPQLEEFMREMQELFGEVLAVTHGKGPGVMKMADDAAARQGVSRIGVGICVEGQAGNCRPEAMVDFFDTDRLRRQQLMDDLGTFKVFNIGGAGTLEEAAIALCSQKLGKKAITPMIFVDPLGAGRDGAHLWDELRRQIGTLAVSKTLALDPEELRTIQIQLLQPETPSYIHCVSSYAEAARIIRSFAQDPAAYYAAGSIPAQAVNAALERQKETLARIGFEEPAFLRGFSAAAAA
jgi:predicted Rossmann-fold nucleotide-binding protein